MTLFEMFALLITLAAAFSYINLRFLHAPRMIALVLGGVLSAFIIVAADQAWGAGPTAELRTFVNQFDFASFVLHGVLGFIIFAGALEVDVRVLGQRKGSVLLLASAGVLISTLLVGTGTYYVVHLAGLTLPFTTCLVFGAIISPTDPVAVLSIMRELSVSKELEVVTSGESLFNDGIAIVMFSILITIAGAGSMKPAGVTVEALTLLLREGLGGLLAGLILGYIVYFLLKGIDDPNVEVFISFALVVAISAASSRLHFSGPLACAVAGLLIGHRARANAMRDDTREALDTLWSFADHVLNTLLFLIVGLQTFSIGTPSRNRAIAIAVTILLVLVARLVSVWIASLMVPGQKVSLPFVLALTWGGLRGAVSIALALSLGRLAGRDYLLQATYAAVLFSVIVQGLTVQPLLRKLSLGELENN